VVLEANDSGSLVRQGAQFDPRSRCFAFEGDRLVGYMSFTGQGKFVSLGYPWVLPGYEVELQETLYERVYGFATSSEYGGTTFAQRFRQPWPAQISFFKRHGFTEQKRTPVYALDLGSGRIPEISIAFGVEIHQGFRWERFRNLASGHSEDELKMLELYFRSVGFDFSLTATSQSGRVAHLGFAVRPDTGFAELIAVARDPGGAGSARALLSLIASRVKVAKCSVPGNRPCPGGRRFRDTAAHGIQPGQ
jgi:hypothetical protein